MYMTIFRLAWLYFGRILADKLALFLQQRREARLKLAEMINQNLPQMADAQSLLCPPCPPCPPCPTPEAVVVHPGPASGGNKIWFGLSGVLLGGAFVLMGYLFMRNPRA